MNAEQIRTHAADALAAGDWDVVAAVMNAVQVTASPRLCYAIESGAAVEDSGNDSTAMLNILLADPNGTMIFQKLSSSAGVEWAHPKTQQLLSYFVAYAAMPVAVKNALTELSAPTTFPFAGVTAEQCEDAWALSLKQTALTRCTEAMEAAQAEYRSADSTPATIVQAMLDSLGAV